jgi:PhnB protein
MPLADQFWGDRYGQFTDPFGHKWSVGQTKASLSEEQLKEAARVWFKI